MCLPASGMACLPLAWQNPNRPACRRQARLPQAGGTMPNDLDDFQKTRADLNEEILGCGHLGIKRFFALDHQAYEPGPLGTKTKELLGLVASAVLRCDDCITYHLVRCGEEGWKRDEVIDALNVALIVGGSITIPHVRRAFARMREIDNLKNS
jgi:AhpD family alkylhydroperoxidase